GVHNSCSDGTHPAMTSNKTVEITVRDEFIFALLEFFFRVLFETSVNYRAQRERGQEKFGS
ncbi:MAG: hypothetical protein L0Y36_08250, partial [Planctomycetales bacterium]|nr:hypothetical protein [Planctomycetales bacterium]